MSIFVLRSSAVAGASNWQDVTVGYSSMPAELGGTDGRKVRLRIDSSGTDWGTDLHTGASATRIAGGAFDGTDCVRLVPPSADQGHAAILRFLDLSNGGAKNTAQTNLGFCLKYGSRYWDLGHTDKLTGVIASQTVGGPENGSASRCGVFDAYNDAGASDFRRIWSVTATTLASYTQPPNGFFPEDGPHADKLAYIGSTINHASDPPQVGSEWLYCEQEVDYRRDRGNADGRNRWDVWARDGYLGYLEIPLTWRSDWDFTYQYARYIEYIGGYWNFAGTVDANNYLDVSHAIVALNRAKDSRIGPPPGFLT